ncbi:MAG: hypothetical protein HY298_20745 [Verrucomicrobia bacterium]|nr:hypothetical protein [Verrucomicrobiota bacterium]
MAILLQGELVLGQDVHGSPVHLMLDWLCSGLLTVANTGSGKSNLVYWLASQFAWFCCSTWLFEPYKLQLRLLLPIYQRAGKSLVILPWQRWRWNLLQCNGCDPRQHAATALDLLVRTLDLPGRAAAILRQGIYALYTEFGVWHQDAVHCPTLFHLFEWVRTQKNLNAASRDAILDRLGAFLLALTPACGAWTRGWTPQDLARCNIVFEMRGASESVRNLLPQSLLFNVFHHRIAQGLVNTPLELFLIFDDGQRIFSERMSTSGEITPLDELAGIIRGAGIGLWPIVQSTIAFSRRLRPNLVIRTFGRLGCHEDYATLAADCNLNPEQLDYIRQHLSPGTFVGQVGLGTHTEPFLFRVPLAKLPAGLTNAEVEQSLAPLHKLPTRFDDRFTHWQPHQVVEVQEPPKAEVPILTENELRLLRAVVNKPGQSVSHYCRVTRLNGRRLAEIRKRLLNQGYIREHALALRPRGRASIVIEPLAPAIEAVRANPENPL